MCIRNNYSYCHYNSITFTILVLLALLAACGARKASILGISIILILAATVISYVMSISFPWSLIDVLLRISLYLNHVLGSSGSFHFGLV